jgi:hypothetical protein
VSRITNTLTSLRGVAASPDSLAGHPALADAPNHPHGGPLFYEMVNYAAHDAFKRVTGGKDSFYDAWSRYRGSRGHSDPSPADMGEDFDFDDAQDERGKPVLIGPVTHCPV